MSESRARLWRLYVGHLVCAEFPHPRSVNPRIAATHLFESRHASEESRNPDKVRPTRHVKAGRLIPRVFIEQVLHAGIE